MICSANMQISPVLHKMGWPDLRDLNYVIEKIPVDTKLFLGGRPPITAKSAYAWGSRGVVNPIYFRRNGSPGSICQTTIAAYANHHPWHMPTPYRTRRRTPLDGHMPYEWHKGVTPKVIPGGSPGICWVIPERGTWHMPYGICMATGIWQFMVAYAYLFWGVGP